jgi:NADPH-dependent 2,4-dienoyl-CoA reductase/sulfur reductase-like enzyme
MPKTTHVELRLGVTATRLDLTRRLVHYRDGHDATGHQVAFDELVLATGAPADIPAWARDARGTLIPGVHPVKNLDDGAAWLHLLGHDDTGGRPAGRRAVVVGGGYIGVEMAEAMIRRGLQTTLITRSAVMSSLDTDMSARVSGTLKDAGIEVITDTQVTSLTRGPAGPVAGVVTSDGRIFPADVVVLGTGARPASELGVQAGLEVGRSGGYLPDARGQIGDRLWAAGDCCEAIHRITGGYAFVPLGTHANKQGRVVGENLTGGDARFGGVLGTAITRFAIGAHHVEIARTGLSTSEAVMAGFAVSSLVTEGRTASGYMPEASPIATKVLADPGTRRLLGVQIVGGPGAGKRTWADGDLGRDEVAVDTTAGPVIERRVPLPDRWLKGFGEVQALARQMRLVGELDGTAGRRFLRSIPRSAQTRHRPPQTPSLPSSPAPKLNSVTPATQHHAKDDRSGIKKRGPQSPS